MRLLPVLGAGALLAGSVLLLPATASASAPGMTHGVPLATLATGDTRTVSQPTIPAVCTSLSAQLTASNRQFSTAQEQAPPDTSRLQAALSGCKVSGASTAAVELTANGSANAFLTGPLTIGAGVVLLVDSGVTLYGSRNAANYQVSGSSSTCGTVSASGGGCRPLISVTGANSGIDGRQSGSGSQGIIDGRGDQTIVGQSQSWWDLATAAKSGGSQNDPRLIQTSGANNFTLYDIDLVNSPNFHVSYQKGNGFTAWGVRIKTPANARNTDGIDPSGATNVTVVNSYIQAGDDGIAIKAGSAGASSNITILNNHFYGTHGISIGSETNAGVTNVLVQNNTLAGSDTAGNVSGSNNGLRIKSDSSRGGHVSQITYNNTCMTGVRFPVVFDPYYTTSTGSLIPSFTGIVVNGAKSVSSVSGAKSVLDGYSTSVPLGLTLENISFDVTTTSAQFANIGRFNSNITASGTGVTVTSVSGSGSVPSCGFPSFPAL